MKILYGCQATGNGHISRARVMAKALKDQNVEVDWVFSGRPDSEYFDMEIFGDYKSFKGMTFVTKNNQLNIPKTIMKANLWQFRKDMKSIDLSEYDLLINDFEPITAWAAKSHKIKTIGLSNQSSYLYDVPFVKPTFTFNIVIKLCAPTKQPIGIHWQQFDKHITPPVVAPNIHKVEYIADETLVYLPFYNAQHIVDLLKDLTDYKFHIFHKDIIEHEYEHLIFHKFSREEFSKKTVQCCGIISNAGFELTSEALQVGKKLLIEPLHNQPEQVANAEMLKNLGWARTEEKLTAICVRDWLENGESKQVVWPYVAKELVSWIKAGDYDSLAELSDKLWAQVRIS